MCNGAEVILIQLVYRHPECRGTFYICRSCYRGQCGCSPLPRHHSFLLQSHLPGVFLRSANRELHSRAQQRFRSLEGRTTSIAIYTAIARIFNRVLSRGGASGRGYKARAVRATKVKDNMSWRCAIFIPDSEVGIFDFC